MSMGTGKDVIKYSLYSGLSFYLYNEASFLALERLSKYFPYIFRSFNIPRFLQWQLAFIKWFHILYVTFLSYSLSLFLSLVYFSLSLSLSFPFILSLFLSLSPSLSFPFILSLSFPLSFSLSLSISVFLGNSTAYQFINPLTFHYDYFTISPLLLPTFPFSPFFRSRDSFRCQYAEESCDHRRLLHCVQITYVTPRYVLYIHYMTIL